MRLLILAAIISMPAFSLEEFYDGDVASAEKFNNNFSELQSRSNKNENSISNHSEIIENHSEEISIINSSIAEHQVELGDIKQELSNLLKEPELTKYRVYAEGNEIGYTTELPVNASRDIVVHLNDYDGMAVKMDTRGLIQEWLDVVELDYVYYGDLLCRGDMYVKVLPRFYEHWWNISDENAIESQVYEIDNEFYVSETQIYRGHGDMVVSTGRGSCGTNDLLSERQGYQKLVPYENWKRMGYRGPITIEGLENSLTPDDLPVIEAM